VNHVATGDDHAGGISSGGCGVDGDSSVGTSAPLMCHGGAPVVVGDLLSYDIPRVMRRMMIAGLMNWEKQSVQAMS
jgi:hypothetical protein